MRKISDEEVIGVYRDTVARLFAAICQQAGGNRALAEDVVQETYLRAVVHWRDQGVPDRPEAWLRTVGRNILISHYRRARHSVPLVAETAIEDSAPLGVEEQAALNEGLTRVGSARSWLLRAFHLEGKSIEEIADEAALSQRAVEGRLRRARRALARAVGRPSA